jgi:amidase
MNYPSAGELLDALRARKISSLEATDAAIARIEALDSKINAVPVRDFERARGEARKADEALARGEKGCLLGLPMTIKEAFNVAGLPTTWGIPGTDKNPVNDDSVVVARLRRAGAVLLGKTNVAMQLADWQTFNPVYGTTNNPFDPSRSPGGSSGGSAAALAAGYVALEFGSDLASSLRIPASFCGVFAHKPSWGIVPHRGFAPPGTPSLSITSDVDLAVLGPMARSASDLLVGLDAVAGPDEDRDAYKLVLPAPRRERLCDHRILVIREHPLLPLSNAVRTLFDGRVQALEEAGCTIGHTSPLLPDLSLICRTFGQLLMALFGSNISHNEWIEADRTRALIAHQWRQLFGAWDLVVFPAAPTTAFRHDHGTMAERRLDIDGVSVAYTDQSLWGPIATLTGLPATVAPLGLAADGLPAGLQAVGPFLDDRTPLAFASMMEREFGGFTAPKAFAG